MASESPVVSLEAPSVELQAYYESLVKDLGYLVEQVKVSFHAEGLVARLEVQAIGGATISFESIHQDCRWILAKRCPKEGCSGLMGEYGDVEICLECGHREPLLTPMEAAWHLPDASTIGEFVDATQPRLGSWLATVGSPLEAVLAAGELTALLATLAEAEAAHS